MNTRRANLLGTHVWVSLIFLFPFIQKQVVAETNAEILQRLQNPLVVGRMDEGDSRVSAADIVSMELGGDRDLIEDTIRRRTRELGALEFDRRYGTNPRRIMRRFRPPPEKIDEFVNWINPEQLIQLDDRIIYYLLTRTRSPRFELDGDRNSFNVELETGRLRFRRRWNTVLIITNLWNTSIALPDADAPPDCPTCVVPTNLAVLLDNVTGMARRRRARRAAGLARIHRLERMADREGIEIPSDLAATLKKQKAGTFDLRAEFESTQSRSHESVKPGDYGFADLGATRDPLIIQENRIAGSAAQRLVLIKNDKRRNKTLQIPRATLDALGDDPAREVLSGSLERDAGQGVWLRFPDISTDSWVYHPTAAEGQAASSFELAESRIEVWIEPYSDQPRLVFRYARSNNSTRVTLPEIQAASDANPPGDPPDPAAGACYDSMGVFWMIGP